MFSDRPSTVAHSIAPTQAFNKACLVGQEDEELPKVASSGIRRRAERAGDSPSADSSGLSPVGKCTSPPKKRLFGVPVPSSAGLGTETWDFPA